MIFCDWCLIKFAPMIDLKKILSIFQFVNFTVLDLTVTITTPFRFIKFNLNNEMNSFQIIEGFS